MNTRNTMPPDDWMRVPATLVLVLLHVHTPLVGSWNWPADLTATVQLLLNCLAHLAT
jgi:hypothetical protein